MEIVITTHSANIAFLLFPFEKKAKVSSTYLKQERKHKSVTSCQEAFAERSVELSIPN